MPNNLVNENSPYLLQHINNPVDWYPWGPEALEKALQENKPIFLSIGYAACHWCHVMAHESFEDPEIASIMNKFFVNIKVDREERPDLDSLYMNAVVALTGQGGWPMSVFLTPDGKPFYGGTYFPPVRRYNMPAFKDVLLSLANTWAMEKEKVVGAGTEIVEALRTNSLTETDQFDDELDHSNLNLAVERLRQSYDWQNGGWGQAPKFPQSMTIQFIFTQSINGDENARDLAIHALDNMSKGGMFDILGGGFSRYSTDNSWLVPHFEKMLYDNAQLARVYLQAYLITENPIYKQICEETIDFVLRELMDKKGGFYSSLDADSEGEEGKFYLWTVDEIRQVLSDKQLFEFFEAAYKLEPGGNFEGKIIFRKNLAEEEIAKLFNMPQEVVIAQLLHSRDLLLNTRNKRIRPGLDDKVLVSWNSLMLVTLSEAARYLSRDDYLKAAIRNADFLLNVLMVEGHLFRSWRNGRAQHNAYLEDYAALILGLISLYQSCFQPVYIQKAFDLTENMVKNFYEVGHGFYDTRDDHEKLFMRPKDIQDNATPSGSSLAVLALLQMSTFYGRGDWRDIAEKILIGMQSTMVRYPTAFSNWLLGLAFATSSVNEIAILGELDDPRTQALIKVTQKEYQPNMIIAAAPYPPPIGSPPLLENRPLIGGIPTAYVCQNFICNLPVTNTDDLLGQIS